MIQDIAIHDDAHAFEVRLADTPGGWQLVHAASAADAAARFGHQIDSIERRFRIAGGQEALLVMVRRLDAPLVQGCYRVTGRPVYDARHVEPGGSIPRR